MDYIKEFFPAYGKLIDLFNGMEPPIQRCLAMLNDTHPDEYSRLFPGLFKSSRLSEETVRTLRDILHRYRDELALNIDKDVIGDEEKKKPLGWDKGEYPESEETLKDIAKRAEMKKSSGREIKIGDGGKPAEDTSGKKRETDKEKPLDISITVEGQPDGAAERNALVDDKSLKAIRNNLHKLIPGFKDEDISERVLMCVCFKTPLKDNLHPVNLRYDLVVGEIVDKIKSCPLPETFNEKPYVYSYIVPALLLYLHRVGNQKYHEWLGFREIEKYAKLEDIFEDVPSPVKSGFHVQDYLEYDFGSRCYRFRTITESGKNTSFVDESRKRMVYDGIRRSIAGTGLEQEMEMEDSLLDNLATALCLKDDGFMSYEALNKAYSKLRARLVSSGKATDRLSHLAYIVPCMAYRIGKRRPGMGKAIPANAYLSPADFIGSYMEASSHMPEAERDFNEDFDSGFNSVAKENRATDVRLQLIKISPKACDAIRHEAGLDSGELSDTDISLILATVLERRKDDAVLEGLVSWVSRNTDCTEPAETLYRNLFSKFFEIVPANRIGEWLKDTRYAGGHNKAGYFASLLTQYWSPENNMRDEDNRLSEALDGVRERYGLTNAQLPYTVMDIFFTTVYGNPERYAGIIDYCGTGEAYEDMEAEDFSMFLENIFDLLPFTLLHRWMADGKEDASRRATSLVRHIEAGLEDTPRGGQNDNPGDVIDGAELEDTVRGIIKENLPDTPTLALTDSFRKILAELAGLHSLKNQDYGDAAHKAYQRHGIEYYLIMLEQKLLRATNLNKDKGSTHIFESIEDSLLDMANYAVMAVDSIRRDSQKDSAQ